MANLTESATWEAGIYQLERADAVDAGLSGNGVSNLQPKQLANRTNWLRTYLLDLLVGGTAGNAIKVARGGLGADNSAIAAGNVPYLSSTGVFGFAASTAYGRSLWNQATSVAAAQTLGIGLGKFAFSKTATSFTTTSTSYQDTGLAVTITPQSTSSQIFVLSIASFRIQATSANNAAGFAGLYRGTIAGGTLIGASKFNFQGSGLGSFTTLNMNAATPVCSVDAPATTSAVTYRQAIRANTGTEVTFNFGADVDSFLFALEVIP